MNCYASYMTPPAGWCLLYTLSSRGCRSRWRGKHDEVSIHEGQMRAGDRCHQRHRLGTDAAVDRSGLPRSGYRAQYRRCGLPWLSLRLRPGRRRPHRRGAARDPRQIPGRCGGQQCRHRGAAGARRDRPGHALQRARPERARGGAGHPDLRRIDEGAAQRTDRQYL
ncbi:Uncharacterised protein [Bordetella pertussis]|nr:Uncharacterised protein [Bordetella pertussis]